MHAIPPPAKPIVVCQAPSSRDEPILWKVILPNGSTAFLTTSETLALTRPAGAST